MGYLAKRLAKCPTKDHTAAIELRNWWLKHYSAETTRRDIMQLNACMNWAVTSGIITENAFSPIAGDIKRNKRNPDVECYSKDEREAILEAFQSNRFCSPYSAYKHSHYYPLLWFAFHTGARHSEISALVWSDIHPDFSKITISKARPANTRILGKTKTGKCRTFPCNEPMKKMLRNHKQQAADSSSGALVFPGPRGEPWDSHNFHDIWKPVIRALVDEGKLHKYLVPYSTRHHFITLSLDAGLTVNDTARLVGNTPSVILQCYQSNVRKIEVPKI